MFWMALKRSSDLLPCMQARSRTTKLRFCVQGKCCCCCWHAQLLISLYKRVCRLGKIDSTQLPDKWRTLSMMLMQHKLLRFKSPYKNIAWTTAMTLHLSPLFGQLSSLLLPAIRLIIIRRGIYIAAKWVPCQSPGLAPYYQFVEDFPSAH